MPPGAVRVSARSFAQEELEHLLELALAAQEAGCRDGQVRAVEALQGREVAVFELVHALGGGEVLEAVLAEVAEGVRGKKGGGRLGDEHPPTVARGGDAGGTVDVGADVALVGQERRARMQADAHREPAAREGSGERRRCRERARHGRKGEEEGVPLGATSTPPCAVQALRMTQRCSASSTA